MRAFDKIIIFLGVIMAVIIAGVIFPLAFGKQTNCGGNSAALGVCKDIMLDLQMASEGIGERFGVEQLSRETRTDLVRTANNHWINGARIFVRTNIIVKDNSKQIVVVCDTPYGNVPQPTIWNGYRIHAAHAVGYSDGTAGLVSPVEFKKINLSEFIDASLIQTNSEAAKINPNFK